MVNVQRWLRHSFMPPWRWRLAFGKALLAAIEQAIKVSETVHRGELRFAIENALAPSTVWQGLNGRQRATQLFSALRVWDTEENSGVLIYVLLADREVHILADRGINRCVEPGQWQQIAQTMQELFQRHDFRGGSLAGIERITQLLATHFPAGSVNKNELPDAPLIVGKQQT